MKPSQTNPFPESDASGNLIRSDVEQAAERVKATTAQATDRTADAVASALGKMATKREQLRASQQRLMSNTAKCIHPYPLTTIGLAFGAGFLVSRLLGRNNDQGRKPSLMAATVAYLHTRRVLAKLEVQAGTVPAASLCKEHPCAWLPTSAAPCSSGLPKC